MKTINMNSLALFALCIVAGLACFQYHQDVYGALFLGGAAGLLGKQPITRATKGNRK